MGEEGTPQMLRVPFRSNNPPSTHAARERSRQARQAWTIQTNKGERVGHDHQMREAARDTHQQQLEA